MRLSELHLWDAAFWAYQTVHIRSSSDDASLDVATRMRKQLQKKARDLAKEERKMEKALLLQQKALKVSQCLLTC